MTYNIRLKNEILENRPMRVRHKQAYAYGLLLFAQCFGEEMRLSTEHRGIARLYASAATRVVGIGQVRTVMVSPSCGNRLICTLCRVTAQKRPFSDKTSQPAPSRLLCCPAASCK